MYQWRLFFAACDKENKPPDEETGGIEAETAPTPKLTGVRPVFDYAAKSCQTDFDNNTNSVQLRWCAHVSVDLSTTSIGVSQT